MTCLSAHLSNFTSAPYLFVGSGFSRRYLGLPDWKGLLSELAQGLPHPFEYYYSSADSDLPTAASLIAEDFHQLWWESPDYAVSRSMYLDQATSREFALKVEVSRFIALRQSQIDSFNSALELKHIHEIQVDGIITTNYDQLCEILFPQFHPYIGQDELLFSATQGIGEIYKIHGCCSDPHSLVLTKADYDKYRRRNPYLAAKLLTMFVEHPTLFLGYSVTDPDVLEVLDLLASSLTQENIGRLHDRLIIVSWIPGKAHPSLSRSTVVVNDFRIPVIIYETGTYRPVFNALRKFKRKLPAKILRLVKQHIYTLVLESDPKGQLFVDDIENAPCMEKADFVLGVGARAVLGELGYTPLTRTDVVEDVLQDNRNLDPKMMVQRALPKLLAGGSYVPIFKYLAAAGIKLENLDGRIASEKALLAGAVLIQKLKSRDKLTKPQQAFLARNPTGSLLAAGSDQNYFYALLPFVTIEDTDVTIVRARLERAYRDEVKEKGHVSTALAKAVCAFDLSQNLDRNGNDN